MRGRICLNENIAGAPNCSSPRISYPLDNSLTYQKGHGTYPTNVEDMGLRATVTHPEGIWYIETLPPVSRQIVSENISPHLPVGNKRIVVSSQHFLLFWSRGMKWGKSGSDFRTEIRGQEPGHTHFVKF